MSINNPADSGAAVYSVQSFCQAHKISRSLFYKLLQEGKGPRIIKLGTRSLISKEAAAEWRTSLEDAGRVA